MSYAISCRLSCCPTSLSKGDSSMSAPFRIVRGVRADEDSFKDYLERLMKMIPAEVVGLYLIGNGFIPADQLMGSLVWVVICLILIIIVRLYGTADGPDKPPQTF